MKHFFFTKPFSFFSKSIDLLARSCFMGAYTGRGGYVLEYICSGFIRDNTCVFFVKYVLVS